MTALTLPLLGELSSPSLGTGLHVVHTMALWGAEHSALPVFDLSISRAATSVPNTWTCFFLHVSASLLSYSGLSSLGG